LFPALHRRPNVELLVEFIILSSVVVQVHAHDKYQTDISHPPYIKQFFKNRVFQQQKHLF